MSYSVPLSRHKCSDCSGLATYELLNGFNSRIGYFCARHAKRKVSKHEKEDECFCSPKAIAAINKALAAGPEADK